MTWVALRVRVVLMGLGLAVLWTSGARSVALARGGERSHARTGEPTAEIERLVEQTGSLDAEEQETALEALQAQHAKRAFPLAWFIEWALINVPDGHSNPLLGWAFQRLRRDVKHVRPHVGKLLAGVPQARRSKQDAIGRLIAMVQPLPVEAVPQGVKVFQSPHASYWLKRSLVTALEGVGPDALPLAEGLIDFATDLLAQRVISAREAEAAGISVSWDFVEYDIERVLSGMGPDVVPILEKRLLAFHGEWPAGDHIPGSPASMLTGAMAAGGNAGAAALVRLLTHNDVRIRRSAVSAIRRIKKPREELRGALVLRLQDGDEMVREWAASSLAAHGPDSVSDLLPLLKDPAQGVRRAAAQTLRSLQADQKEIYEPLLALLQEGSDDVAYAAAQGLAAQGPQATPTLPALFRRLNRAEPYWRQLFIEIAAEVAQHDLATLHRTWQESPASRRRGLVRVLARLDGEETPSAGAPVAGGAARRYPPLEPRMRSLIDDALRSKDLYVRVHAAAHLASRGQADVLPVLGEGFRSTNGYLRMVATEGMDKLGKPALAYLPKILERVRRDDLYHMPGNMDRTEKWALGFAITSLGRHDLKRMFGLIDNDLFEISYHAGQAFEGQGAPGFDWLVEAWPRARTSQKMQALDLVGSGRRRTGDGSDSVRAAALRLARRGLQDGDPKVRLKAVASLPKSAAWSQDLVPVLLKLLDSQIEGVASSATYELSQFGTALASFRPELRARLEHRDPGVRIGVRRMLRTLEEAGEK